MHFTFAMAFKEGKAPDGHDLWRLINEGPDILRPTSVNDHEPLRRIKEVNIEKICEGDFIWQNGRKCLGMFDPHGWKGKATLSILLTYSADQHQHVTREVLAFIRTHFDYRLLYGVAPTRALMNENLQVHQLANCGAIPPDERIIISNRNLYEFFEET